MGYGRKSRIEPNTRMQLAPPPPSDVDPIIPMGLPGPLDSVL
jgi:hypothetical protein